MDAWSVRSAMACLLLGFCVGAISSPTAHAETQAAKTVRGPLSVGCRASKGRYEGRYVYKIGRRPIPALGSECDPQIGISFIYIEQIFNNGDSTTLLIIEGVTATSQNIRVIHIPKIGMASVVDSYGGDGYALVMKSPTMFRLISPGGGFAISEKRKSTWTCVVEIDFANHSVSGDLAVPYEPGIPNSVCEAEFKRIVI